MSSNDKKILYVEDDPGSRILIQRLLQAEGYHVVLATNGLEGIQMARQEYPQLILMDINMSDLDGYEVTTKLRSLSELNDTPIVALTANSLKGDKERALVAGCDGYITKPIDVNDFPKQVSRFLGGYRELAPADKREQYLAEHYQKVVQNLERKVIALEEANERLRSLERIKSDFVTISAHELRTPITLVYGYANVLSSKAAEQNCTELDMKEISTLADRIHSSAGRLNDVVNDILNVALIQANKLDLNIQRVHIAPVVQGALTELKPAEKGRHLTIALQNLADLPPLYGDEARLRLVFWNLLSNAIKYTPDGGHINVIGWANELDVYLQVQDNGIGIDPKEQNRIFEQFYIIRQVDYHSSSKVNFMGGGLGIGLSIVEGIVKAHGGAVSLHSTGQAGEGTSVTVRLPRFEHASLAESPSE
jgi:signal transduction histidine kinase